MGRTAENIKRFRLEKGMTQEQLADVMGKHKTAVSNWERGENKMTVTDLEQLCVILGCTPEELIGWESPEEKTKVSADMVAREIMQSPLIKELEKELEGMSDAEVKRIIRMARAAKDEE
jgi:transcriptional regulator with XRE-family HTH domain